MLCRSVEVEDIKYNVYVYMNKERKCRKIKLLLWFLLRLVPTIICLVSCVT